MMTCNLVEFGTRFQYAHAPRCFYIYASYVRKMHALSAYIDRETGGVFIPDYTSRRIEIAGARNLVHYGL